MAVITRPEPSPAATNTTSSSSRVPSVHRQAWHPPPTVESLDPEGAVLQPPAEQVAELLYRLDDDHRHAAASGDGSLATGEPGGPPTYSAADAEPTSEGDDDRDASAHWARQRQQSRMGRKWWRRPNPYWLLLIQVGHAISMGCSIAPKAEIYNSLACLIHYPTTSNDASDPIGGSPSPSLPSVPRPIPSQPTTNPVVEGDNLAIETFTALESRSGVVRGRVTVAPGSNPNGGGLLLVLDGLPLDPLKCRKSPEVQRAAAQFTTVMTITQGVLAALTTGWWGRLSDRFGRTKVMAVAMGGIIFGDIIFLCTAKFPHVVPGGYRFLIIGPLFDGLLGGMPTLSATNNAYIADCTPDGTRAQIYSRIMGVLMLGLAVGPVLGSAIIRRAHDVLAVFYFSTILHSCMFLVVLFLLPESLSVAARSQLVKQAEDRRLAATERDEAERRWEGASDALCSPDDDDGEADDVNASGWSRLTSDRTFRQSRGALRRTLRRIFGFLNPLEIFLPSFNDGFDDRVTGKASRWPNWNLTLLAIGFSFSLCLQGAFPIKFQYIQLQFGWGPAELGPFLSAMGTIRALHLLIILPTIVRWLKPKVPRSNISRASSPTGDGVVPVDPHARHRALHDSRFDLRVIQFSLLFDVAAYIGILITSGPTGFLAAMALTPFGGGAGPAMSSLALALLPSTRIAGRLFGAMAVLQAVIATVVGPLVFGITYSLTTRTWPKTVFVLCLVVLICALTAFSLIRLARPPAGLESGFSTPAAGRYTDNIDSDTVDGRSPEDAEVERGRKRRPKPVNGSGFSLRAAESETGRDIAGSGSGSSTTATTSLLDDK